MAVRFLPDDGEMPVRHWRAPYDELRLGDSMGEHDDVMNSETYDFCKRVERAAKAGEELELFGTRYVAAGGGFEHPYEQKIVGDGSDWGEIMKDAFDELMASACESCSDAEIEELEDYIRSYVGAVHLGKSRNSEMRELESRVSALESLVYSSRRYTMTFGRRSKLLENDGCDVGEFNDC